jgi:aryl-alcohol dehydrogenase-like predicted oxidoreductase/predicted kinase
MRLSTAGGPDDAAGIATITAAADAGIAIFDTAHAYGVDETTAGHNERLLAGALRECGADSRVRIVTKGGMTRTGGGWVPDGRARAILADCEASLAALDGLGIDLYLIHAPDPRTPWKTSVRALARLLDEGAVRHVGLANVNRPQLEEAADLVEVTAIQVALSALDDSAVRGGLVDFCTERGIALIAYSPLGGPRRVRALARRQELVDVARALGTTPEEVALAWVLDLSPVVVAIPGARRPETARSAARAAALRLTAGDRAHLATGFAWPRPAGEEQSVPAVDEAEVVVVMGVPGAGKSRYAEDFVARGYARLNRDQRGGSLRQLSEALDEALSSGMRRVVLDNTYLTRAARSHVIETATRHHVGARCLWMDTPLAQAQVNLVDRLLDRFHALPDPEQLHQLARREPGILTPTRQMRAFRDLEPPSTDEGFVSVERIRFERAPRATHPLATDLQGGIFVAAAALTLPGGEDAVAVQPGDVPILVYEWRPGETVDVLDADVKRLSARVAGSVVGAICPHPGGAPVCWCRPPLPGLLLAFARREGIDPSRSALVGTGPAHRTLATTFGARYVQVRAPA